jgi:peptidoglycan hydrolase CwlO-like protein
MFRKFGSLKMFLVYAVLLLPFIISGQPLVDSIISERNNKYQDYLQFRESLTKHTWTDLMKLKDQAGDIIKTDNIIINEYLIKELLLVNQLESEIIKLNNELKLTKKEIESRESTIRVRENFIKMLFYGLIAAGILVILFIAILIDRHIRYRGLKSDIERIWASAEDRDDDLYKNEELGNEVKSLKRDKEKLLNRIDEISKNDKDNSDFNTKLRNDIKRLKEEIKQLQDSVREKDNNLKKEVQIRKAVEEEIKELIRKINPRLS